VQLGSGRRATVYEFDYAYSVFRDIPTHRMTDSEKVNQLRTKVNGRWLEREATISDEVILHAALPGKIEGTIDYMKGEVGFIISDQGDQYYFTKSDVIEVDRLKPIHTLKRIRFYPSMVQDTRMAILLEVL
jgi:hypothetical protein